MTHDEMIAVLVAHRDGRKIQWKLPDEDDTSIWYDYPPASAGSPPPCEWGKVAYRIKPGVVCKLKLKSRGRAIYIEGSYEDARTLEFDLNRRGVQIEGDLESYMDKTPREEFELNPV